MSRGPPTTTASAGSRSGPWLSMMGKLAGKTGCLFCAAPDVYADWPQTQVLWDIYWPLIHECDLPAAIVLQDGCTAIPSEADAVFIGGSTEWKLSDTAHRLVRSGQGARPVDAHGPGELRTEVATGGVVGL